MFHFVISTSTNGEAYNMAIRGGDWGGLDGVDVWGTNIWIHDVSPTRLTPASNIKYICGVLTISRSWSLTKMNV